MSRPRVPGARPAVTAWFLLALTALAALVGSGLELGAPAGSGPRALAAAEGPPAELASDGTATRVPFVGAVLGSATPAVAAPVELTTAGADLLPAAPLGVLEQADAHAVAPSYVVVGGSGRAPPVATGT